MCLHRLYANTMPFNVKDLRIHGFWYPRGLGGGGVGPWNQSPSDTKG